MTTPGYQRFLAELKRRRVFRVMAVYGVVAFGVIEAADNVFPRIALPDWSVTLVVWLALLGFPIAIVLAWAFDSTSEGVKRTADASPEEIEAIIAAPASQRIPAGLMALVGVAALILGAYWVGTRTAVQSKTAATESSPADVRLAFADLDEDPRPSIAVLPFVNMSADEEQEYFSDGMTEEVINVLAKISELRVAARTSAFAFKGRDMDLRLVGDSLGVGYLVEGSVRKDGNRLRITAQLIDAADGSHLWSESYNRTLDDVFAIQTEIAEAIAGALRVPLGLDDASDLVTPTADLEAYDLYLAGRGHIRGRGSALSEAIRLFEAAIARDSSWAPAWAALAEATELLTWYPDAWDGGRPEERAGRRTGEHEFQANAERAAQRAIQLDPSAASARVALGSIHRYRHEWREAEAEYLRALEIDPDNPEAFQQYGEMLEDVGRIAEAVRSSRRALDLDGAPIRHFQLASALFSDGQTEAAIRALEEGIALDPDGQVPQARWVWFRMNLDAGHYEAMFDHASIRFVEARESIEKALESGDLTGVPAELIDPTLWMIVGRPDSAAAALLDDFTSDPDQFLGWIWSETFDPMRDQPAYLEALEVVNLEGRTPLRTAR
jgi:TolB-like protein